MKYNEIKKLTEKERKNKIDELKLELLKSRTNLQKTKGARIKQIKKIIARIHTFNKSHKEELNQK